MLQHIVRLHEDCGKKGIMEKRKKRFGNVVIICWLVAVCLSLSCYFKFVSRMVYEESSHHLTEIYVQVAKAFEDIVSEKWKILKVWEQYLGHAENDAEMLSFLDSQKEEWGFTDFYFISSDGSYCTVDGESGFIDL